MRASVCSSLSVCTCECVCVCACVYTHLFQQLIQQRFLLRGPHHADGSGTRRPWGSGAWRQEAVAWGQREWLALTLGQVMLQVCGAGG